MISKIIKSLDGGTHLKYFYSLINIHEQ